MPEKTNTEDPTLQAVRLLREGGYHEAAADLATKALQRLAATPNATPGDPGAQPEQAEQAEQLTPDQLEGRALIDALNEHVRPGWTSTPMLLGGQQK